VALSAAERQRKRYHECPRYRARRIASAKAYAKRNAERLRARRHTPEFRSKRAAYMRLWVLAKRIFEEWQFSEWAAKRKAA